MAPLPRTRRDKFDNLVTIESYTTKPNADFIIQSKLPAGMWHYSHLISKTHLLELLHNIFTFILSEPTTIHIALSTILYLESQGPLMPLSQTCSLFRNSVREYGLTTSGLCHTTAFGVINLSNTSFNFKMTDWSKEYYIPVYEAPHMSVTIARFALWKKSMLALETDDKETIRQSIINRLNKGERYLVELLIRSYKLGGIPDITEERLIERHPRVPCLMMRYIEGNMLTPPKETGGGWEDDLAVDALYSNFSRPPIVTPYQACTSRARRQSSQDSQTARFYFA